MNWKVLLAMMAGLAVWWWGADGYLKHLPIGVSGDAGVVVSALPGAIVGIAVYLVLLAATPLWSRIKR